MINAEILGEILYLLGTELCCSPPRIPMLEPYPQGEVLGDGAFGR